ncbi:MAG TPA: hypothetical protein PLZ15_00530 [Melioribacteraceae bacterium]|nr:hypothetical protein [Melioribacteraceae bacterium]
MKNPKATLTFLIRKQLIQIEIARNKALKSPDLTPKEKRILTESFNNMLVDGLILYDELHSGGSN